MSTWFSEYRVRTLAERIAPRISPFVEAAIYATIRAELPGLLMEVLRDEIPEAMPKGSITKRRQVHEAMRAAWTGRNARELATRFGYSVKQVHRICSVTS